MNELALVLTVGGSHQPLLAAIESVKPDFVLFVCSNDDPVTGNKGSYTQITGQGKIIKAEFNDTKPTLENIPSQAGFSEDQFRVVQVNSDEIDQAYSVISAELSSLVSEYKKVVCDYTGGTKSMSASLVVAAVDNDDVSLQVVAGARGNLRKIDTAFQNVTAAKVGSTRFKSSFDSALNNWNQFNYSSALNELNLLDPSNSDDNNSLQTAKLACKALVDWDVFNHQGARETLGHISKSLPSEYGSYLKQLGVICSESKISMPNRILDLWLNTQRCAKRDRYDDATARVYRLIEWCSQWLLKHHKDIDTADIPEAEIPPCVVIPFNERSETYQASLVTSWELAAEICGDDTKTFWKTNKEQMLFLLNIRNNSVLAHGYAPISKAQWRDINKFADKKLIPFMLEQFKVFKLTELPKQLPTSWNS